jgi:hypothetical protein
MNVSIKRAARSAAAMWLLGCAGSAEPDGAEMGGNVIPPPMNTSGAPTAGAPATVTPVTPVVTPGDQNVGLPGTAGSGSMVPVVMPGAAGSQSPVVVTPDPVDADVTCYKFITHGGSEGTPYQVGIANDAYFNFTFMAPWTGMQYARSFRTIIDNATALHHWLFFKEPGPVPDGAVSPSSGTHPGSELIHGWAPGGENLELSADVGFEMPATGFTLELHYNSGDPTATDTSGVEVCVTSQVPTNIASISWLGSDVISNTTSVTGTCRPTGGQRIHILGGTPHMHTHGTHMKVEIVRAAGGVEMLHDMPFDFSSQISYMKDTWLEPGDSINTTCTYDRPVSFGEGTGDEMCYFFTLYYPKLSLTDAGLGAVIHGPNSCGVIGLGF